MNKTTKISNFCRLRKSLGISKKAQGISINVIIIAVIALIVLVVIIAIFLGRINLFGAGVSECKGVCRDDVTCAPGEAKLTGPFSRDNTGRKCAEDDICCIPVTS